MKLNFIYASNKSKTIENLSVTRNQVYFSKYLIDKHNLRDYTYVSFAWDENNVLHMVFGNKKTDYARKLTKSPNFMVIYTTITKYFLGNKKKAYFAVIPTEEKEIFRLELS